MAALLAGECPAALWDLPVHGNNFAQVDLQQELRQLI
jgi:hypothetical protein